MSGDTNDMSVICYFLVTFSFDIPAQILIVSLCRWHPPPFRPIRAVCSQCQAFRLSQLKSSKFAFEPLSSVHFLQAPLYKPYLFFYRHYPFGRGIARSSETARRTVPPAFARGSAIQLLSPIDSVPSQQLTS